MTEKIWEKEPNEIDFVDDKTGYACAMRRNGGGAWCGYIGLPESHPLHGKKYNDDVFVSDGLLEREIDIDEIGVMNIFCAAGKSDDGGISLCLLIRCHGGLTYSGKAWWDEESPLWWLGFDCSHSGDLSPKHEEFGRSLGGVYRNAGYVRECIAKACGDIALVANSMLAEREKSQ